MTKPSPNKGLYQKQFNEFNKQIRRKIGNHCLEYNSMAIWQLIVHDFKKHHNLIIRTVRKENLELIKVSQEVLEELDDLAIDLEGAEEELLAGIRLKLHEALNNKRK